MSGLLAMYLESMEEQPALTKLVTSAVCFGIGDITAQALERKFAPTKAKQRHNLARTARMVVVAVTVFTPLASLWYAFLDSAFGDGVFSLMVKLFLDQTLFGVIINSAIFIASSLLDGKSIGEAKKKVAKDLLPTLKVAWRIWPFVQLINFAFVPENLQILVVNLVNLPWCAYLAMQANAQPGGDAAYARAKGVDKDNKTKTSSLSEV
eukprot:82897_1